MVKDWEPASVKAQLRLTSLRLGQLQESKDSQNADTRRRVAVLIHHHNLAEARIKAQNLLQDEALGDLLEKLGMYLGFLLEHLNEIDSSNVLSSDLLEAISAVIFAAHHVASEDLKAVAELLAHRLGKDFTIATSQETRHTVPIAVLNAVPVASPSPSAVNACMKKIASDYHIDWSPEVKQGEMSSVLLEILDPVKTPVVNLPRLRLLSRHGLPDEPQWLRPRTWKLFLGTLPVLKASWKKESQKQRQSYYDSVRHLLEQFSHLPPPSNPLTHLDTVLLDVSEQISRVPYALFEGNLKETISSTACPLNDSAVDGNKIPFAHSLDLRLKVLQIDGLGHSPVARTTNLRMNGTPELSHSSQGREMDEQHQIPNSSEFVHPEHRSALLRLLFVHTHINPGHISPHIPPLLVLLYVVLNHETEQEDLDHVEADAFWLFEAMIGEFSELEDEEGMNVWMQKFSDRLAWADCELSDNLRAKGLDPALPHYSYQWLAPLLTRTLPLSSVIRIWDALLSRPMRERAFNPKLEFLLDICTSLLLCSKAALFSLGTVTLKSPSAWTKNDGANLRPNVLPAWQLQQAFLEGVSFLQHYPLDAAGGIDKILQTAVDLAHKREHEKASAPSDRLSLTDRLKVTMWKGFTNQPASPELSPEGSADESSDSVEDVDSRSQPQPSGLASRWATTVWRGITNQSSMDVPSTPTAPSTPLDSPVATDREIPPDDSSLASSNQKATSSLWGYAEKIKDSDALAMVSKVSSNWRAKALTATWSRPASASPSTSPAASPTHPSTPLHDRERQPEERYTRSPLVTSDGQLYSPPSRPAYFRPPRDSFIATSPRLTLEKADQEGGFFDSVQSSLASLTGGTISPLPQTPKSVPRPLLLGSSSSVSSPPSRPSSRPNPTAVDQGQWAEVVKLKNHAISESQSSMSSLSPNDVYHSKSDRKDWDSDGASTGTSRRVLLNRRSISPMALASKIKQSRHMSGSSASSGDPLSPPWSANSDRKAPSPLRTFDSSPLLGSPQIPTHVVTNEDISHLRYSPSIIDTTQKREKSTRKICPLSPLDEDNDSPKSSTSQSPFSKYSARPPTLDIQDVDGEPVVERKLSNPNALDIDWQNDDPDAVITPRAATFKVDDEISVTPPKLTKPMRRLRVQRKSSEGSGDRPSRLSTGRVRKYSNAGIDAEKSRESSAEEGDDEGYDDLLTAYESESSQASASI